MFKLVVLSALLAFVAAAPGHLFGGHHAPLAYAAGPAISTVNSYSYAAAAPAVVAAPLAYKTYAAPAVVAAPVAYKTYAAPTVVAAPVAYKTYAAPAVVAAPVPVAYAQPIATAITKTVHYESKPVVTGYTSQVLKPNLGALATPAQIVTQEKVLAPARSVQTITPQITQVQPEVSYQKVAVDVPVQTPYVSEVEVRTPTVVAPAPIAYAAPAPIAYKTYAAQAHVVAAPAVAYKSYAAPALVQTAYAAAPAAYAAHGYGYGHNFAYGAAPVAYGAAPVAYGAAPVAYKQW